MVDDLRTRWVWALAYGCVLLGLPTRIGTLLAGGMTADRPPAMMATAFGIAAVVTLFGLCLAAVHPRVSSRTATVLLAGASVATFGPYLLFEHRWGPIAGILAASLALRLHGLGSLLGFAVVAVGDAALAAVAFPVLDLWPSLGRLLVNGTFGLLVYGVVRLAQLVTAAVEARRQLARLEVEHARLSTDAALRDSVGDEVTQILAALQDVSETHPSLPSTMRDVASRARRAGTMARELAVRTRAFDSVPPPGRAGGGESLDVPPKEVLSAWRVARIIGIVLTVLYCGLAFVNLLWLAAPDGGELFLLTLVCTVAGTLHLYVTTPGLDPPRWWAPAFSAEAAAVLLAWSVVGFTVLPLIVLVGSAAAVRLRPAWAVVSVAGIAAALVWDAADLVTHPAEHVYHVASLVGSAVGFWALSRLPLVADELMRTRRDAARVAVSRDRLRMARDVHDLLASQLSAVALQAEVAARRNDSASARRDLDQLAGLAALVLRDMSVVAGDRAVVRLADEVEAAVRLLTDAGLEVTTRTAVPPLPPRVDAALAVTLRESVTNIVRHASARSAQLQVEADETSVTLVVLDDGRPPAPDDPHTNPGQGLGNLAQRIAELGGRFAAGDTPRGFTVRAELPLSSPSRGAGVTAERGSRP